MRPARSPIRPNTSAPSGRNRNPAPNSARAAANPAASGSPEKKVLEMTPVRLPNTKKSYHSNVVPADEAATTVRSEAGLASALGAAVSAMWCLSRCLSRAIYHRFARGANHTATPCASWI